MSEFDFNVNDNVDRLYKQESLLDILIEYEGVIDSMDLYAFKNWIEGEIVDGPKLERYWITVTMKYPYDLMPDPRGANRLLKHGARIRMGMFTEDVPIRMADFEDRENEAYEFNDETGEYARKTEEQQYWLIEIRMPRRFIEDMEKGMTIYDENEDEEIDVEDATDAEDEGLDDETLIAGENAEGEEFDQF